MAFSNSYAPAATEVKLGASKVLSGKDLKEGQFSFQLKDADGKVLQTAKNAAGGTVGFEAISYDKPGTYTYSISEVDDGQKNVTYDAAEHQVTVMVTDDGAGHLVATVTYDGDVAPVFKNTYTPPTTPPVNPPTEPPPIRRASHRCRRRRSRVCRIRAIPACRRWPWVASRAARWC